MTRVVLVPGVLALLPAYRSLEDPVAPLRSACLEAVRWLGPAPRVLADAQGARVAAALLEGAGVSTTSAEPGASSVLEPPEPLEAGASGAPRRRDGRDRPVLVVGNGSARRTDASPGPFDPRAVPFDDALGAALRGPDPAALRGLDAAVAEELWAATGCFADLADLLEGAELVAVDYDDAPYGVQYWVTRWQA